METALRQKTIIQPGGVIEIHSPHLPVGNEAEVIVIWQASEMDQEQSQGWPPGFFEQTFGCLRDDPITRFPQGDYETRDVLR